MSVRDDDRTAPPPVEGLSDIAWQRVEKNLFAALDCDASVATPTPAPPRRWSPWLVGGGLALAGAAAALLVLVLRDPAPAAAPTVTGPDDGAAPSRVVTQDSSSEVSFGDATITVDADSALTMYGDRTRGVLIILERGGATFEVAPRDDRPPFVVQAGEVTVRVIGTRFEVLRNGDAARVDVIEGHVEVVARGRRVDLHAGETWSSGGDWEAAVRGQAASPGGAAAAPFAVDGRPWEGSSSADGAVAEESPSTRPRPRQRSRRDDQDRYEQAMALEPTDARRALGEYKKLAEGGGKWAAPSLFAAGRLAAELGDEKAARKLLDRYLRRYPDGGNAADARDLLARLGR